ncbi:hypothetical protein HanRHA438_Chr17g0832631 [Helianthus annuus]|nr:hypothetical protein HanRHA438_Chr17g0832631 [Helianthus annuus]
MFDYQILTFFVLSEFTGCSPFYVGHTDHLWDTDSVADAMDCALELIKRETVNYATPQQQQESERV